MTNASRNLSWRLASRASGSFKHFMNQAQTLQPLGCRRHPLGIPEAPWHQLTGKPIEPAWAYPVVYRGFPSI